MSGGGYRERCLSVWSERCFSCGDVETIHVHHRDGDRKNDDLDNLIPLCASCHRKLHFRGIGLMELLKEVEQNPRILHPPELTESQARERIRKILKGVYYRHYDTVVVSPEVVYNSEPLDGCPPSFLRPILESVVDYDDGLSWTGDTGVEVTFEFVSNGHYIS